MARLLLPPRGARAWRPQRSFNEAPPELRRDWDHGASSSPVLVAGAGSSNLDRRGLQRRHHVHRRSSTLDVAAPFRHQPASAGARVAKRRSSASRARLRTRVSRPSSQRKPGACRIRHRAPLQRSPVMTEAQNSREAEQISSNRRRRAQQQKVFTEIPESLRAPNQLDASASPENTATSLAPVR